MLVRNVLLFYNNSILIEHNDSEYFDAAIRSNDVTEASELIGILYKQGYVNITSDCLPIIFITYVSRDEIGLFTE